METKYAVNFRLRGEMEWRLPVESNAEYSILTVKATNEFRFTGQDVEFACTSGLLPALVNPPILIEVDAGIEMRVILSEAVHFAIYGTAHNDPRWAQWVRAQDSEGVVNG